jgi:hypothetical protein
VLNRPPSRQRQLAKTRRDEFRAREREAKQLVKQGKRKRIDGVPDTLRCYPLMLLDSEVREIVKLVDEAGADTDEILIGYAWRRWVGDQAAQIMRNALQARRSRRE